MYNFKLYWALSYFNFCVTGFVSFSAFASLIGTLIEITSSVIGLKICATFSGIKIYKSIIKKTEKKHDKIVLLAKTKLNSIDVLISKALNGSCLVMMNLF